MNVCMYVDENWDVDWTEEAQLRRSVLLGLDRRIMQHDACSSQVPARIIIALNPSNPGSKQRGGGEF